MKTWKSPGKRLQWIESALIGLMVPLYRFMLGRHEQERCIILAYHNVTAHPKEPYSVSVSQFKKQMDYLVQHCNIITLDEWLHQSTRLSKNKRNVVITFDDAYESLLMHVAPVFSELKIRGHCFVPVEAVNSGTYITSVKENRNQDEETGRRPMSWRMINKLAELGIEPGSHSMTHRRMGILREEELLDEIIGSRKVLQEETGRRIDYFAFPFSLMGGRVCQKRFQAVRVVLKDAGYRAACTTDMGFNTKRTDPFHLRRIQVFANDSEAVFQAKLLGALNWKGLAQRIVRGLICLGRRFR